VTVIDRLPSTSSHSVPSNHRAAVGTRTPAGGAWRTSKI